MSLKKLKKAVNRIANKAADIFVPKEVAPIAGILASFAPPIISQLLTAAASAKMRGEIDPKAQALQGILSFLRAPQTQTAAEAKLIADNPELVEGLIPFIPNA